MSETIAEIPFFSKSMMRIELDKDQVEKVKTFHQGLLETIVEKCGHDNKKIQEREWLYGHEREVRKWLGYNEDLAPTITF